MDLGVVTFGFHGFGNQFGDLTGGGVLSRFPNGGFGVLWGTPVFGQRLAGQDQNVLGRDSGLIAGLGPLYKISRGGLGTGFAGLDGAARGCVL